jgi:hypothetical protein
VADAVKAAVAKDSAETTALLPMIGRLPDRVVVLPYPL